MQGAYTIREIISEMKNNLVLPYFLFETESVQYPVETEKILSISHGLIYKQTKKRRNGVQT